MNLLDLMGVEYRKSRRALYWSLFCAGMVYVIVLIDTLLGHSYSEQLAICAFLFQAGILLMKYLSSIHYDSAEEIRRIAVLKDGLGIEPCELEVADIVSRTGRLSSPPKRIHIGKYFASEKAPGIVRFFEDIEESAFWTRNIASATSKGTLVFVLIGSAISFFSLVGIVTTGVSVNALRTAAEAVVVTLGFIVTSEFLFLYSQYVALSQKAERKIARASSQLDAGGANRDAAILLFGEYNCALAGSPPLPAFMYRILHAKLSAAWSARKNRLPVE